MPDIFIDDNNLPTPPNNTNPASQPTGASPIINTDASHNETQPEKSQSHEAHTTPTKSHNHLHLFAGYCDNPKSVAFGDQQEHEILLLLLRRHFITNLSWLFKAFLFALIPLGIELLGYLGLISLSFFTPQAKIIIYTFYYFIIISGYMFVNYITWFYNISIVTNVRVLDVDYSNIVVEHVDATKLSQVEDVGYAQIGIIRSIFDYGDVRLQTAGAASNFEFLAVPHPERVIKVINNLIGKSKHA